MSAHENNDAALVIRVAAGERAALLLLYDRYVSTLLALAQHMVGPGDDAEEVVQEIFLYVWQHAAAYRPRDGTVRAWLILLTRRRSLCLLAAAPEIGDQLQPSHFEVGEQQAGAGGPGHGVDATTLGRERHAARCALATLHSGERQFLEAIYFRAQSPQDAARQTNLTPAGVQAQLERTLHKLRRSFDAPHF